MWIEGNVKDRLKNAVIIHSAWGIDSAVLETEKYKEKLLKNNNCSCHFVSEILKTAPYILECWEVVWLTNKQHYKNFGQ